MIRKSLLIALCLVTLTSFAQEKPAEKPAASEPLSNDSLTKEVAALKKDISSIKNLKVSGWIQSQLQFADSNGVANFDGGQFSPNSDKRFTIRRARIKFTYNSKNARYVMQLNGTERGLNLTEVYGIYTFPFMKSLSFCSGIFNRPFGFEIEQGSADRESPERSRYTQILMPNERDLGAKLTFAPLKGNILYGLHIDAGFFNGQGVAVPGTTTASGFPAGTTNYPVVGVNEFDFGKDFIGRACYYKDVNKNIRFGLGASHYNGGVINANNVVYTDVAKDTNGINQWKAADTTGGQIYKGKLSKRVYTGFEAFFSVKSFIGTTTIRGEYISGIQPGSATSSQSPFLLPTGATYLRSFNGMYVYFIQRIAKTKHEVAVKYEWYDPNTKVSGADILGSTKNKFTSADIKYTQLQFGYNYYFDDHVKFMIFYNMITNEITGDGKTALNGFQKDIKDNILTIRVQYRF
jgi:hypothetical protein